MIKNLTLVLLFVLPFAIYSNDTTLVSDDNTDYKSHFLSISPSYQFHKYLDQQISPLLYKGSLSGLNLAFEAEQLHHKYCVSLGGFYGNINGETKHVSYSAMQGIINIKANYLHAFWLRESLKSFFGASVKHEIILHYNPNLQNAAYTSTFLNHLAFAYEIEKLFSWKAKTSKLWFIKINRRDRTLKFSAQLDIPIIFYNLRPPYSTISDFSNGENLMDYQAQSFIIGSGAFQLNNTTSLTYYLSNNNAFRLSYIWQVYKFKDTFSSYQSAQHIVEFSLLFKFN